MTPAVLELNDQSLLLQTADGSVHSEPGFARLTPRGIETGEDARDAAWREPQHSYSQYWCHLNETPLPAKERWARHHADIAFAQLRHIWRSTGSPDALMVLVPGSFTEAQLSLLLGMVGALPCKTDAVIDSALAACFGREHETLFVDLQLHQSVLTLCRREGQSLRIADQEVFPDLGLTQIHNSVARHISSLLIDSHRYDPLHASDSEQAIFDQLPAWLLRLGWDDEVTATLVAEQGELPFILRRADVRKLVSERLVNIRSYVSRFPGCEAVLSHASGLLAGLSDDFSTADVAGQAEGIENCLSHHELILGQNDGLIRIRTLDLGEAVTAPADAPDKLATHLLCGDRALPLRRPVSIRFDEQGMQLSKGIDLEAALTVVLRNRSLETVHCAPGTDASLPQHCRPGAAIVVGGHQLRLIEVRDG